MEHVIMANGREIGQVVQSEESHKPEERQENIINDIARLEQQRNMKSCKLLVTNDYRG